MAVFMEAVVLCRPIAYTWDKSIDGTCGNATQAYEAVGIINLITDLAIIILPMPLLWQLQLPLAKKVALTAIFGIGIVYVSSPKAARRARLILSPLPQHLRRQRRPHRRPGSLGPQRHHVDHPARGLLQRPRVHARHRQLLPPRPRPRRQQMLHLEALDAAHEAQRRAFQQRLHHLRQELVRQRRAGEKQRHRRRPFQALAGAPLPPERPFGNDE